MNKGRVKAAILSLALVQMGTNGIAPALSGACEAFPDVPAAVIQYLMTFPSLMVVIVSLFAAGLSVKIAKKYLAAFGSVLVAVGGVLAVLIHTNIVIMFVWAGVIGFGIGLIVPMLYSLITDCFEGEERAAMMGNGTSFSNLGSMIMTLAGGFLASAAWQYNYFVYLLAVPGLILSLLFLPKIKSGETNREQPETKQEKSAGKLGSQVILYCMIACLFLFLFNVGPTNLSMLVTERGLGDAAAAGNASTVFLLGGTVLGLIFGKVHRLLKDFVVPVGALTMCIGFLVISHAGNMAVLCIGCFLAGMSISFAMPQCMLGATQGCAPQQATMATALIMAIGNLGTFATPVLTTIAGAVSGSTSVIPRFILALSIALVIAVLTFILTLRQTRRSGTK